MPSASRRIYPALALAALAAVLFPLYRVGADFPLHFFPDEPGKVAQVLSGSRNFRHPQLMLEAATLACRAIGADGREAVVGTGRAVSAAFAVGAVLALTLAGYRAARWPGFAATAVLVGLCPAVLVHAHYFKEDTALILGFALTTLAAQHALLRPSSLRAAALLGAAAGITLSAKYIGVYALLAVIALLALAPGPPARLRIRRLAAALAAALVVVLVINHRVLADPASRAGFLEALRFETNHAATDHRGVALPVPTAYFLVNAPRHMPPLVALGLALLPLTLIRRRSAFALFLAAFPLGFLLVLTLCPLPDLRYALPAVVLLFAAGAMGLIRGAELLAPILFPASRAARRVLPFVVIALAAVSLAARCHSQTTQFTRDSRYRLAEWVAANLLPDAIIAQDTSAGLTRTVPSPKHPPREPATVRSSMFVSSFGDVENQRRHGVSYIVITDHAWARYLNPWSGPASLPDTREHRLFLARRAFYSSLLNNGHGGPVWRSDPPTDLFPHTNPAIRVYRLGPRPPREGG